MNFNVIHLRSRWIIQPKENLGQCRGWVDSTPVNVQCVHDTGYTWIYYLHLKDKWYEDHAAVGVWCDSEEI